MPEPDSSPVVTAAVPAVSAVPEPVVVPASQPAAATQETPPVLQDASILGRLRARREKIGAAAEPLDIEIPNYDGELVVRCKWVPLEVLQRTQAQLVKMKVESQRSIAASADTLVAVCEEVFVRENGELKPLSTDGVPVRFDQRLAYALGFEDPGSARKVCIRAFANDYALIATANTVTDWLADSTRSINEETLGE